ncbi:MAG TPA: phosphoglucomutase (alpha-D-glucose-1,6-bisphosphate-dependent) [Blastocatellia bacterium]|nr:phosphoglucomutase (alpha-D-glucose-1,6-bisphosphate-dependent) [Blastocatellia bacterium]
MTHPLAGQPAPVECLINVDELVGAYYDREPDTQDPSQLVSFGTSGHRGSALDSSFNEAHILAISQAICDYRKASGLDGPLFLGKDSHALSTPAEGTALEVLAANGVETVIQRDGGLTPTPSISRAILVHNRNKKEHLADGIVITPSHNPPRDGGFKYNPSDGGPADTETTDWIQNRANELLREANKSVRRITRDSALKSGTIHFDDFLGPYVKELTEVLDLDAVAQSKVKIGVDPMGGAAVAYWEPIAERYRLDLTVVNPRVDPKFGFMTMDHDGKIRMDCSSPYAMAGLVRLKDRFDVAFGNDTDADRHGIVTRSRGLLNPNHYLAVAIHYLINNRPRWSGDIAVGKTLVSSGLIDRVVAELGRKLYEVPVGFKWFVSGLLSCSICFGGEESAGASFLSKDGKTWTTEKDGIIMALLSAEILARTGRDPGEHYQSLTALLGTPYYRRIDAPASPQLKLALKMLSPTDVTANELAGEPIVQKLTAAPGNNAQIGGLKVVARNGWFAARPSGTENVYKLYAESFVSEEHLNQILDQAREIVAKISSAKS